MAYTDGLERRFAPITAKNRPVALDHDTNLMFLVSHQYVDVYLDGESIYSIRSAEWLLAVKTVGST